MSIRSLHTVYPSLGLLLSFDLLATCVLAQPAPAASPSAPAQPPPAAQAPSAPTEPPPAPVASEGQAPTAPVPGPGNQSAATAPGSSAAPSQPPEPAPVVAADGQVPDADSSFADNVDLEAVPAAAEVHADSDLSAVVVTANRREENVQSVPIAIRVVSSDEVLEKNLTTSNDVERLTPNLSGQASGGRFNKPRWFLRGIGSNDPSINLEAPIGVYQDEVFIALSSSQAFPLFDLERVEVLKGPQGSLWGKNTTAGAVHYISKAPKFDKPSGYARASFGNYGSRAAEAGFGAPIIGDKLAARASFLYEQQEGWATNLATGDKDPNFTDFATRLQLLWNVTDDLDVRLIGRYRGNAGGGNPAYPIGVLPGGGIQQNPANPNILTPGYGDSPRIGDDFFGGLSNNLGRNSGVTGIVNLHFGDYTLTSVTGWDFANNTANGYNYWPPEVNFTETGTFSEVTSGQFTQELRVTSPREDRFNWIAGLHYFNWDLANVATSATFTGARTSYIRNQYDQVGTSYAAFASGKLKIAEPFTVNGGLRYTSDHKVGRARRHQALGTPTEAVAYNDRGNWFLPSAVDSELTETRIKREKTWGQLTFDVTPELLLGEHVLTYARFARGFKSGTFNPTIVLDLDGNTELPDTDPEVVYAWEIGAKTQWLGGKLTANAAAFYYLVEGVQLNVQQPNPTGDPARNGSVNDNAAGARIFGAELELDARPIPGLRLSGGLGLLNGKYTKFKTYQGSEEVDASGNQIYRMAPVSFTVSGEYQFPTTEHQAVAIGTDWSYRDRVFFNAVLQDSPVQEAPPYALGNAELRYLFEDGRFVVQGYIRNLLDQDYPIFNSVVSSGANGSSRGQPRQFGLQLIAKL